MSTQERRVVLLSPGDPEQRTGGYLFNKRLVQAWRDMGLQAEILPLSWPLMETDAARVRALPADVCLLADGLLWESLRSQSQGIQRPASVLVHSLRAWEPAAIQAQFPSQLSRMLLGNWGRSHLLPNSLQSSAPQSS